MKIAKIVIFAIISFFCKKVVTLQHKQEKDMEDFVVSIPPRDLSFMEALASRMGWKLRPRRASIEQFINSCPKTPVMTDEEIAAEVNAVRYGE